MSLGGRPSVRTIARARASWEDCAACASHLASSTGLQADMAGVYRRSGRAETLRAIDRRMTAFHRSGHATATSAERAR